MFKLSRKGEFFEERRVCPPQMRVTSGMRTPKGRGAALCLCSCRLRFVSANESLKSRFGWPPEGLQLFLCRSL